MLSKTNYFCKYLNPPDKDIHFFQTLTVEFTRLGNTDFKNSIKTFMEEQGYYVASLAAQDNPRIPVDFVFAKKSIFKNKLV